MANRFSRAPVTGTLLAIIFAVFALEWSKGALNDEGALYQLGAISADMFARHQPWRAVTGMFLHAGFLHLLANSWGLLQLGTLYEAMFGSVRFTIFYFVTGIIASCASAWAMPRGGISVGASGAILGILGAFIFSIRRSPQWRHQPWTRGLTSQLVFWAIVNIALGFSVKGIDNTAHLAGLTSGLLLGLIPHHAPPPPPSDAIVDVPPTSASSE